MPLLESAAASIVVSVDASAVTSFIANPSIPTPILPRQECGLPPISERALEPTPVARKFLLLMYEDFANL